MAVTGRAWLVLLRQLLGCGTWGLGGGGRVGTLLGPEASGPELVVPVGPVLTGVGLSVGWGLGRVFLDRPPLSHHPSVGGGGLVGLLFEICIVDASIN